MIIYSNDEQDQLVDIIYDLIKGHPDLKTIIVSPTWHQSKRLFELLTERYKDITLEYKTDLFYKLAKGNVYFHSLGDGDKIRGLRPNNILVNQYNSINKEALDIVIAGFLATAENPIEYVRAAKRGQK